MGLHLGSKVKYFFLHIYKIIELDGIKLLGRDISLKNPYYHIDNICTGYKKYIWHLVR